MTVARHKDGFTLLESLAALSCLIIFSILVGSAWRANWSVTDEKRGSLPLRPVAGTANGADVSKDVPKVQKP